jgi:hypothetical protein
VYGTLGLAMLAVLVAGFATRVPDDAITPSVAATPVVLYGIRGSDVGINRNSPNGTNTVCTEMAIARSSTRWHCLTWEINISHAAFVEPRPYDGPCGDAIIDQTRAAWTCLSTGSG